MTQDQVRDSIVTILNQTDGGLTVEAIREALEQQFGIERGERSLQDELKQMVEDELLERERLSNGTPGRPPYYYFVNGGVEPLEEHDTDGVPDESALGDEDEIVPLEITSRGDVELQEDDLKSVSGLPDGVYWDIVENQLENSQLVSRVKEAAPEIAALDPLETVLDMLEWTVEQLNDMGRRLWSLHNEGKTGQVRVLRDLYDDLAGWASRFFHEFWQLTPFDRQGPDVLRIPEHGEFLGARDEEELDEAQAKVRLDAAREVLNQRIFGDEFVRLMPIDENVTDVVGTDSSVARVSLPNRSRLTPETGFELFAGAAALDHDERRFTDFDFDPTDLKEYRRRAAFRRGLILSEQATPQLLEGQVRKARFAALDLRQYREANRIIDDEANWRPHGDVGGELGDYAGPDIMFLDGRLTPIVHLMSEFASDDIYGELVRREIREFAQIGELASDDSWETDSVFAGVVKQPGISWFAPIVFWYLETQHDGDVDRDQNAVIRNISQPPISDVVLPHLLFLGLSESNGPPDEDETYVTFRVLRRFYDNSVRQEDLPPQGPDDELIDVDSIDGWMSFFERVQQRKEDWDRETIDLEKYSRFGFASACANVGSLMCYAGPPNLYRTHQQGVIRLPRIEVLTNPADDAPEKLNRAVSAYALKNYSDDDHSVEGFSALDEVPVVVPRVIVESDKIAKYARDRISEDVTHEIQKAVRELR